MELSQDTLLAILAAVLIADVVVVAIALIWTQVQKRRHRDDVALPPVQAPRTADGAAPVMSRSFPAASNPPTASASGAPGGPGIPDTAYGAANQAATQQVPVGVGPGIPAGTPAGIPVAVAAAAGSGGAGGGFGAGGPVNPSPTVAGAYGQSGAGHVVGGSGDPTIDPLTGLLTAGAWTRNVVDEEARIRRYHRPATVVVMEVEGLDRLVSRLGPASVERIVPAVADTIRRGAREADHVARIGSGRFAVLMPETDEILAINYIERVRKACDLWLESGAVSLRLAIGWASSTGDGSLVDAEALATDRMFAELRRAARSNDGLGGPGAYGTAESPAG
jgi:diguanylate cyclase (GGDEF)-like protein